MQHDDCAKSFSNIFCQFLKPSHKSSPVVRGASHSPFCFERGADGLGFDEANFGASSGRALPQVGQLSLHERRKRNPKPNHFAVGRRKEVGVEFDRKPKRLAGKAKQGTSRTSRGTISTVDEARQRSEFGEIYLLFQVVGGVGGEVPIVDLHWRRCADAVAKLDPFAAVSVFPEIVRRARCSAIHAKGSDIWR